MKWTENLEIERKFLVDKLPKNLYRYPKKEIVQGYLPSMRIRKIDEEYKITIKQGDWLVRTEFESNITQSEFFLLWSATEWARLEKTRYYIYEAEFTYELDIYRGHLEGLFTVEVEFDSVASAEQFTLPVWFGREVTGNKQYNNAHLAKHWRPQE